MPTDSSISAQIILHCTLSLGEVKSFLGKHTFVKDKWSQAQNRVYLIVILPWSLGSQISYPWLHHSWHNLVPKYFKWLNILHAHLTSPSAPRHLPSVGSHSGNLCRTCGELKNRITIDNFLHLFCFKGIAKASSHIHINMPFPVLSVELWSEAIESYKKCIVHALGLLG